MTVYLRVGSMAAAMAELWVGWTVVSSVVKTVVKMAMR